MNYIGSIRWSGARAVFDERLDAAGDHEGEGHLEDVREDERDDAPRQDGREGDGAGAAKIQEHEPCGAECVADQKAEGHREDLGQESVAEEVRDDDMDHAHEYEAEDVAAGISEKYANAAVKAGKDREADGAEEDVGQNGQCAAAAAEDKQDREHGECLQCERDGHGDADPGADGDDGGGDGDVGQVECGVGFARGLGLRGLGLRGLGWGLREWGGFVCVCVLGVVHLVHLF